MATNPFSPGGMVKKEAAVTKKPQEDLPYETTGVSSRDNVRKQFWEMFSADSAEPDFKIDVKDIVHLLENQLYESTGSDAKTRQYRDKTKNIQLKLKGSRYLEQRRELRIGSLTVEEVCTEEWLSAKSATTPRPGPQGAGRGGMPVGRGRGLPPGPAGRGRGVPPPGLPGRGRGALPGAGRGAPMPRPGLPGQAANPVPPAPSKVEQEETNAQPQ